MTHRSPLVRPLRRIAAALLLTAAATHAPAAFVSGGGGDYTAVPLHRTLVFGGIDTDAGTDPGYLSQHIVNGVDWVSNSTPLNASGGGSLAVDGAAMSASGWSAYSGFMASRNFASVNVGNARVTDDYYMVAGQGGASRVHFNAGTTAAQATFTWTITGTALANGPGEANARLDFAASTTQFGHWFDLFAGTPVRGPGTYQFTAPVDANGGDVFLYFWSSAYALLQHGAAADGANTSLTANFGSTFVLTDVELVDDSGQLLTDWTMTDAATGEALFDQDGRIAGVAPAPDFVPEPASAWLLAAAGAALAMMRRRPMVRSVSRLSPG